MARAIEQIERELAALCELVKAIAAEYSKAYTNYLQALGQATRSQLILASYQICTQGYAKQFLNLSFNQRQQLQQAIRKLGKKAASELLLLLSSQESELGAQAAEDEDKEDEELEGTEVGVLLSENSMTLDSRLSPQSLLLGKPLGFNPIELAQWQENLEAAIAHILKTLSLETNHVLQQSGILPQKLPPPLLEAATAASEVSDLTATPPNLMNLLIETENSQESEESSNVTQLIAIQLRLPEIEFADAHARSARNQIRQLENRLNSLKREYQKKQRERIVAEAEAAWRSSWFEE